MTDQPTLFAPPPADGNLTDRQAYVLELVRTTPGGIEDVDVGARLHARRGKHASVDTCPWCADEGKGVLEALRRRGLVIRRRTGAWQATTGGTPAPIDGHDPSTAPLPEGF